MFSPSYYGSTGDRWEPSTAQDPSRRTYFNEQQNTLGRASSVGTESYKNDYIRPARIERRSEVDAYNQANNTDYKKYQSFMAPDRGGKTKKSHNKRKISKTIKNKNKRKTKRNSKK
jgi:hypothetical protein